MTVLSMAGYNILPRHQLDRARVEQQFEAHRAPPGICVVSHEPQVIERLRVKSTGTLFIYRDSPPGHGTDDNVYEKMGAREYVRYLHAKAPPGAALYLGNEPNDYARIVAWTLEALDECDLLGRRAVVLNLYPGHPARGDWLRVFAAVLLRIAGTWHVLGLHEYFPRGSLAVPHLVGRCEWVDEARRALGLARVLIAITELGMLDGPASNLDPHKGYQRAGATDAEYATFLRDAYAIYAALGYVIGTALYCMGKWGDGIDVAHANDLLADLATVTLPAAAAQPSPPAPLPSGEGSKPDVTALEPIVKGAGVAYTLGEGATWLRPQPGSKDESLKLLKVGATLTLYAETKVRHAGIDWYVVEAEGVRAWMGQWHPDFREQFIKLPPAPEPPKAPTQPPDLPPIADKPTLLIQFIGTGISETQREPLQAALDLFMRGFAALSGAMDDLPDLQIGTEIRISA